MTTDSFGAAGNFTWTCPAGVTSVTLGVTGADGSGAAPGTTTGQAGGGGGGGAYGKWNTVTVVPGTVYNLTVGAKGGETHGSTGVAGGQSSITIAGVTPR